MGTTRLAVIGAICALMALTGCGDRNGGAGGDQDGGPSPTPADPTAEENAQGGDEYDEIYVFNTYGDEQGYPDQRPEVLVASEFTTFNGLTWSAWGSVPASGDGYVLGTWCLPECQDDPYPVTVELGEPELFDGDAYYTTYWVTEDSEIPDDMRKLMEESDGGRLMVPSGY
ncbi:hypothetical protein HNR23_005156 [Nocardiopsis mwathae]|uniref:Lipoprotein n=1 Tax=Nocardiopsis mwathae TaxID=1472723 RepID=A0A7W9YP49_9ACTN|nr:hypothetical protein [Nocardiopsis mwathae]MBB6175096.1 hypothetical protein [Nocardiopsis mwathae]